MHRKIYLTGFKFLTILSLVFVRWLYQTCRKFLSYRKKCEKNLFELKLLINSADIERVLLMLKRLWKFGFTSLSRTEVDAYDALMERPRPRVQFPLAPFQPLTSGIFGRLDNPAWLLTNVATRRSALHLVRIVKHYSKP